MTKENDGIITQMTNDEGEKGYQNLIREIFRDKAFDRQKSKVHLGKFIDFFKQYF